MSDKYVALREEAEMEEHRKGAAVALVLNKGLWPVGLSLAAGPLQLRHQLVGDVSRARRSGWGRDQPTSQLTPPPSVVSSLPEPKSGHAWAGGQHRGGGASHVQPLKGKQASLKGWEEGYKPAT